MDIHLPEPDAGLDAALAWAQENAGWHAAEAAVTCQAYLNDARTQASVLQQLLAAGRMEEVALRAPDVEHAAHSLLATAEDLRSVPMPDDNIRGTLWHTAQEVEEYAILLAGSTQELGSVAHGMTHDRQQLSAKLDDVVRFLEERLDVAPTPGARQALTGEIAAALADVRAAGDGGDPGELRQALTDLNHSLNSLPEPLSDVAEFDALHVAVEEQLALMAEREQALSW